MNIMNDYPSKRRKTSPFTSILVTPENMHKELAAEDEYHPSVTAMSTTCANLSNDVHTSNPLTDSSENQQKGPAQHTGNDSLKESQNGFAWINESLDKLATCAVSPERVVIATSTRTKMVSENETLGRPTLQDNPHSLPSAQCRAAVAVEPRASPPAADADDPSSAPQIGKSTAGPMDQGLPADTSNGKNTMGQGVAQREPSIEREAELPFTPKKQSLDVPEPRLPPTPTQLGLEAPPTRPKGVISACSPRKLRRKRQVGHKVSPLKLRNSKSTVKVDEVPYVSNLGPRVPVVNVTRSAQMYTMSAQQAKLRTENSGTGLPKHSRLINHGEAYIPEIFEHIPSLAERLALFLPFSRQVTSTQNSDLPYMSPPDNLAGTGAPQPPDSLVDTGAPQPPDSLVDTGAPQPGVNLVDTGAPQPPDNLAGTGAPEPPETADSEGLPPPSSMTAVGTPDCSLSPPSSMTVVENGDPGRPPETLGQLRDITFSAYQKLMVVTVQLMADKATGKYLITNVSSISSWADAELRPWLRTEGRSFDRNTIEQAIKSYWKTSLIRASCWKRCEDEIGATCIKPTLDSITNEPEITSSRENLPGTQTVVCPHLTDPPGNAATAPSSSSFIFKPTGHSIQPHLGRQSLLFTQTPVSLLIIWKITITTAGTAQNHISAHPAYPKRWADTEEGPALAKVEEAFDGLLARKGVSVFESIKELCGRIFVGK